MFDDGRIDGAVNPACNCKVSNFSNLPVDILLEGENSWMVRKLEQQGGQGRWGKFKQRDSRI